MKCPLCGSDKHKLFHDSVWSLDKGQVFRCQNCDITFIDPIMTLEEEREFYRRYNQHVQKRGVSASRSPEELHEKSFPAAQERYRVVRSFFAKAQTVLEIGSSTGAFLSLLDGRKVWGVEPADANREFSRSFLQEAYRDVSEIPSGARFDLICMFHVFEHIRNPKPFLHACRQRLNAGGILVLEVPHICDPLLSLYKSQKFADFYFQPMHPYVYSAESLRAVVNSAGFREKSILFHQRYGLENHLQWLVQGKPGGNPEWQKIFGESREYKEALQKSGMTDTLFFIAEV